MRSAGTLLVIVFSREASAVLRGHVEETYPEEACGILVGRDDAAERRVVRVRRAANTASRDRRHTFALAPSVFLEVEDGLAAGEAILGFYHSHPDLPAGPSEADQRAAWPWYSYVIASVARGGLRDLASWRLRPDRGGFDEERVVTRG